MKHLLLIMILSLTSLSAHARHRNHHNDFIGVQIGGVKIGIDTDHNRYHRYHHKERGYNRRYKPYKKFKMRDNHRPYHYHGPHICYTAHTKRRRGRHHDVHTDYVENAYGDIERINHHTEYSRHAGEVHFYQKTRVNERINLQGTRYTLPKNHWTYVHPHPSSKRY